MGRLDETVAIVTGAGRGLGRAHALRLAAEGASVVVNDLGAEVNGLGSTLSPANEVVEEIKRLGGRAVASGHDVADWDQAQELVQQAIDTFGDLHVLVNNAGILRDRTLAKLAGDEWDDVIRVHLTGHAAPTHHAFAYWRARSKEPAGAIHASVVHTSSISGYFGNFGQAAYGTAKLGVVALSRVAAIEGARYGIRSNAVAPSGRSRMWNADDAGLRTNDDFDPNDPANVSALVAWLAWSGCPANSQIFHVWGGHLNVFSIPSLVHQLEQPGRWSLEDLDEQLAPRLVEPFTEDAYLELFRELDARR